ncbi:MAG: hypothetical protein JW760_10510 [Spirochaetales bacterium]|nr:hypothetical protein [Spirochaetales bacterium]
MKRTGFLTAAIFFFLIPLAAQETGEFPGQEPAVEEELPSETNDTDALSFDFEDPFTVEEESSGKDSLPFDFDDPFALEEEPADATEVTDNESLPEGSSSFDSLFEGDDMIEKIDEETADTAPQEDFLTSEELTWGGSFSGSFDSSWNWEDLAAEGLDFLDSDSSALTAGASASLYFDARPDTDFRVFGKLKIQNAGEDDTLTSLAALAAGGDITANLPEGWTSAEDEEGNTVIYDAGGNEVLTLAPEEEDPAAEDEESETGTPQVLELSVFELFSDFSWKDTLFFRFGKHTIRWGTGYFWSPADVLNLTAIDTEDPTADREGPISLKLQAPFGLHNGYLYLIANEDIKPSEIAVAPKMEFVLGNTEVSLAGYYQKALVPRAIVMATGFLGKFGLFGEAVVSQGSDRTFVRLSKDQTAAEEDEEDGLETVLDTFTVPDRPFFSATLGFRRLHSFNEPKLGSLMVVGQYYYNGEGYADSTLLAPAYRLLLNPGENGLTISDTEAQPEGYEAPPALSISDITNFGRHYGALIFSWNNIFDEDLSFSTLFISNLSDLSCILSPNLTFTLFEKVSLTAGLRWTFGPAGGEFTNPTALIAGDTVGGGTLSFTLSGSIGGGSF